MATSLVSASPAAAAGAQATQQYTPEQIAKATQSAKDFESMAIGQLLQPMFATVDTSKGLFGGGQAEATWKPMMVDEIGKMIEKNGGIGLADSVMHEILQAQAARS